MESLFNNVAGPQVRNFIKNTFRYRRFPVNIAKLKNAYFEKHQRNIAFNYYYSISFLYVMILG